MSTTDCAGQAPASAMSGAVEHERLSTPALCILEFAEYMATQAECLLMALEYEDMARVAWDEDGSGSPEFERLERATESRCEHAKQLRSRVYEFRKRAAIRARAAK